MELWDLKANALKLMFADTDLSFTKSDFSNGVVYENGNTRDKLTRMNDSIRRAIDLYYQYTGHYSRKAKVKYIEGTNILDTSNIIDFGIPTRVDLLPSKNVLEKRVLNYHYDHINNNISVDFKDFYMSSNINSNDLEFVLYYMIENKNLPDDSLIDELTFDLDTLNIPYDIQRMIPKYIKGEVYEEDEYGLAINSKNEYIQYLINSNRKFSTVQTKVKSNFRRG